LATRNVFCDENTCEVLPVCNNVLAYNSVLQACDACKQQVCNAVSGRDNNVSKVRVHDDGGLFGEVMLGKKQKKKSVRKILLF